MFPFFSLTIQNINTYLDAIAQANVEKKRDVLKTQIQKVIRCTSATEQVRESFILIIAPVAIDSIVLRCV